MSLKGDKEPRGRGLACPFLTVTRSQAIANDNQYCVEMVSTQDIWKWILIVNHNPNLNVLFEYSSCIDCLVYQSILYITVRVCPIIPLFWKNNTLHKNYMVKMYVSEWWNVNCSRPIMVSPQGVNNLGKSGFGHLWTQGSVPIQLGKLQDFPQKSHWSQF